MKQYLFLLLFAISFKLHANVIPNSLFSDNVVLQRGVVVPVWGTADENESITVTFNKNKQPVGERLSLAAFALAYNSKAEYEGPIYESMKIVGNKIEITFSQTGNGLVSKNDDLKDFVIAGDDKKFVPAKAEIKGNKVIVYSDNVVTPVAVPLGWRLTPQVNLYNKEGLCAAAFRTDIAPDN